MLHCARPVEQPVLPIAVSMSLSHWDEYELCLWFPSQVFASVDCCGEGAQCDRYRTNKRRQFVSLGSEYKLSKCMLWKATQHWIPLNSIKWWWCCWVLWKLISLLGAVSKGGEKKIIERAGLVCTGSHSCTSRTGTQLQSLFWCGASSQMPHLRSTPEFIFLTVCTHVFYAVLSMKGWRTCSKRLQIHGNSLPWC